MCFGGPVQVDERGPVQRREQPTQRGRARLALGQARDRDTRGRVALDLRMLGRERALALVAVLDLACCELERFLRRDDLVLVGVGLGARECSYNFV